jgi:hypothetical protein
MKAGCAIIGASISSGGMPNTIHALTLMLIAACAAWFVTGWRVRR